MTLVVVLLNFGLFFVLNVLAPLVAGCIAGFLASKIRDGIAVTFVGTLIVYSIIFVWSEWTLGFTTAPLDVVVAIIIMGLIGVLGGLIGAALSSRSRS